MVLGCGRAILKTQSGPPVQVEPKHISSYLRRLEPFASPRPVFLGQIDERTLRAFPRIAAARTPFCNSSPLTGHYPRNQRAMARYPQQDLAASCHVEKNQNASRLQPVLAAGL